MEHTKISENFDILTWIPNIECAQKINIRWPPAAIINLLSPAILLSLLQMLSQKSSTMSMS